VSLVIGDFRGTVEDFARVLIGDNKLNLFGQSMDAPAIAEAMTNSARDWINERPITLVAWSCACLFGVLLTLVR